MTWPMVALGEVCRARSSLVNPTDTQYRFEPHIGPDSIERDNGRLLQYRTASEDGVTSGKYRFEPGDILYSKIRPNLNKVALVDFPGLCSADMYALDVDRTRICPEYLVHLLRSNQFVAYATSRSDRANIPKVNRKGLMAFEFTLPPLEEQRRIAAILDRANDVRAAHIRRLERIQSLERAVFVAMFERVKIDPVSLGSVVDEFRYGTSNKSGSAGRPTLRIPNVVGGTLNTKEIKLVVVSDAELSRLRLEDGDLLFVRTNGNREYVGRSAVYRRALMSAAGYGEKDVIYASYLIRARLDSRRMRPRFVHAYLATPSGRQQLLERARTSAGQFNVNTKALASIQVPEADLAKQLEFESRLSRVDAWRKEAEAGDRDYRELFATLQARAFSGEL